jgi:PIN domain nuclease of toxin-antitoxin system
VSEKLYLLDTSALLTLIQDEAGADRVEEILRREKTVIPWVVLLEVYYISLQEENEQIADQRLAMLKQVALSAQKRPPLPATWPARRPRPG